MSWGQHEQQPPPRTAGSPFPIPRGVPAFLSPCSRAACHIHADPVPWKWGPPQSWQLWHPVSLCLVAHLSPQDVPRKKGAGCWGLVCPLLALHW